MKTCPKCKMTLDAHSECPVCHADITDVPYNESESEGYTVNKYFFIYVMKYAKFFAFCLLVCALVFVTDLPNLSWFYLISMICLAVCFFETFYTEKYNSVWQAIYSEDYLETTKEIRKYGSGILAIGFVLLPLILRSLA